eukprot:gb/GFBE01028812.1/.p1 GENE.gb/GFBE01028812.1/~~gb/GFBE01028812.1/.p1  ORF type:complete len:922 (+),score=180.77 gb/GFBE01028812.1/:1-2766(+)
MNFIVAASSGTHIYRAQGLEKPVLSRSLPRAQAGNVHCFAANCHGGYLAILQENGAVGLWDFSASPPGAAEGSAEAAGKIGGAVLHEVPAQSGRITRCYFSPQGSFLVTWEPLGTLRPVEPQKYTGVDAPAAKGGSIKAFSRAENLSIWSLTRRSTDGPKEFEIQVAKDGTQRLGVNVDHLDGSSGLLVRRVDPGLIDSHNKATSSSCPAQLVLTGDLIVAVNGIKGEIEAGAKAMSEEIQRAEVLRLRLRRGPSWVLAQPVARFFAPHISALRWPPVQWTCDERHAFRTVTDEVLVLDGRTLQQLRRLEVHSISQLMVSQSGGSAGSRAAADADAEPSNSQDCLGVFCPAASSCSPSMVRVFTDFGKAAKPALTKSFFTDAAWVTMKWDPCEGTDLLVLVHSSEVTEDDLAFRTLHGQGGNGLYLLRAKEASEPIAALSSSQDGAILDVQWCPRACVQSKSLVLLQGPQPALVSVFTYGRGGATNMVKRIDLGRFGVRNCLSWDSHGRSFCLRVQSERGAGISNEADSADLFDVASDGTVARRAAVAVIGRRERDHFLGPSVGAADFSPDGRILLTNVHAESGSEVRFVSAEDGQAIYRLKFDSIFGAMWQPALPDAFVAPDFPPPQRDLNQSALAAQSTIEVELHDKELLRRRLRLLQGRLREVDRIKSGKKALEAEDREKLNAEGEVRQSLAEVESELAQPPQPERLLFEITTAQGMQLLEAPLRDLLQGGCRNLAWGFCREHRLDPRLAGPLSERLEQLLPRQQDHTAGYGALQQHSQPKRQQKPQIPQSIDHGDKEAVRRRVRALQKKIRDIDKLKTIPESSLDVLQKEKIGNEAEIRSELSSLEKELNLLDRPPRMVFDVETEQGTRYIEFREGDDCLTLARQFCEHYCLDPELASPLALHMEGRLEHQEQVDWR